MSKNEDFRPRTGEWLIEREGVPSLERVRIDASWPNAVLVTHHKADGGFDGYADHVREYIARDRVRFVQRVDA